ncbi:uncharacterized protein LOC125446709 [Stegostoma tigrinum]|uniref:uncharacterized protein LOC125446709 n=1 Tax=Stegostoma tigrinum TaxID=3053191 RepID=UPI00202AFF95|nr:uncharacterized protein LOC125446709 [Stegostoma tigrinum]
MQSDLLQWAPREYSLKEFVRKFHSSLPKIVKITEGFLGRRELETVSAGTILRIHSLYSQKRAIVESNNRTVLSIPVNLESVMFNVLHQKYKSGPFTMKEVLLNFNLPVTIISTEDLTYREMNNPKSKDQELQQLRVKQIYEQEFLLGHSIIDNGKLSIQYPFVIPMYMKEIKLVIAEGFNGKDETEWNIICNHYNKIVKDIGNLDHFICTDIILLDKDELDLCTGQYSEIEPIYVDLSRKKPDKEHEIIGSAEGVSETPKYCTIKSYEENKPEILPEPNTEMDCSRLGSTAILRKSTGPLFKFSHRSCNMQPPETKHIVSMNEVPGDILHLNVDEVCDCLNLLNMGMYIEAFQSQQVDGRLLFDLDRDMMLNTFGMSNFHIMKLIRFRKGWRPK